MSSSNEPAHGRRKSNSLKSALRFRPRSSWSSRTVRPKEPILFWRATARPMGSEASQAVPFFGSPARFPTGGALLADLLGLPLRMMVCTRPKAKERRYRVKFFELAAAGRIPRKARAEHLQNMAARYAMHLEEELKSSPLDWANYYDFWESLS